jgi:hypothetical protein
MQWLHCSQVKLQVLLVTFWNILGGSHKHECIGENPHKSMKQPCSTFAWACLVMGLILQGIFIEQTGQYVGQKPQVTSKEVPLQLGESFNYCIEGWLCVYEAVQMLCLQSVFPGVYKMT